MQIFHWSTFLINTNNYDKYIKQGLIYNLTLFIKNTIWESTDIL